MARRSRATPPPSTTPPSSASTACEVTSPGTLTTRIPGYAIAEVLHDSPPRVIYAATRLHDGRKVVLKTLAADYPRRQEVAELHREYQVMQQLDLPGVMQVQELIGWGAGSVAIEMEPFGISLADRLDRDGRQPLSLARFFPSAIELARILGRLHEADIVHKDVVPRNILVDEATGELRLIDFGIASELDRERQSNALDRQMVGSLPYMSPEQTGRMNRDLDYRTDYYSLGATFYELLTGNLPFEAETALEWVHRHISQLPVPPATVNPAVPPALSEIVLKLMAKNAEDRYQSTYGLVADLERCRDALAAGTTEPFPLGTVDLSRRFQLPQKLYGREVELARLTELFERVAAGSTELCLVSGYSGVGKSRLVGELSKSIARERGWLIDGKFDQFQQSTPYMALAQAFRSLVRQLLTESTERLVAWRGAILEALGPNVRLLVDLIGDLELIVGGHPPVPELPPTEAQNRFQIAFVDFVKVFTSDQPLVVFLDDLQWSDGPTLALLQRLVTSRDLGNLFLIGAYRSNEVDAGHPLRIALDAIAARREIAALELAPLDGAAVARLVADTLHTEPAASQELAELVYDKARGNPFFITEILKRLHEHQAIAFEPDAGCWRWDLDAARRAEVGDNVVEFMVASLRRLPEDTQQVLQLAACIGNRFDLRTLATVHGQTLEATGEQLHEALRRNMVVPLTEAYRYVGLDAEADAEVDVRYRFQHDRVQQAAYALIDDARKAEVHLSIGTLLQRATPPEALDERLMEIVGHLNSGRDLVRAPERRRELAELELRAGEKARSSSAYASALRYVGIGLELVGPDGWEVDPDLTMRLSRAYQQCAYLAGNDDLAETWGATLLERARSDLEKAQLLSAITRQYSTVGKMQASIEAAIQGLNLLGVEITLDPDQATIDAERAAVDARIAGREIGELVEAPHLTDPVQLEAIRLLMEIFPAAFLSGSGNLFPYLVLKSVHLSLQHGNSPESAFAYAAYGMLLCGGLNDPALGYRFGRLAVEMNDQFEDIALKSRVIYVYAMFVHHWSNHWSTMTPWFLKGIETGYRSGDLLYLAYSAQDCIIWDPKLDLETAAAEQRKYLEIVKDTGYRDSYDSGSLFLQMQLCFLGRTDGPLSMCDDQFDEEAVVAGMRGRGFMTGIANHHIYKAEICWFHEAPEQALAHVEAQDELIASSMSLPQLVRFTIVAFLVRAALLPSRSTAEQATFRARLESDLAQMARWAENCEDNFRHLELLMRAELVRLDGDLGGALKLYEGSIAHARASGFQRDEGMANERAAQCLIDAGMERAAEGYRRAAHYLYYRWSAHHKVALLEERFPDLRLTTAPARARTTIGHTSTATSGSVDSGALDLSSVMKASQTISGELVLAQLWKTTLQLLIENAGAQRGCFVVRDGARLVVEARVSSDGSMPTLDAPIPLEGDQAELPLSLVFAVLRTREPLVLADASASEQFSTDPYIARFRPRSVLCVPIQRHGKFEGAIYMENNLTTGAFTEDRIEVIRLLSAQAAISTENAQLYADQTRLIEAQQRFVPSQFLENLGHSDLTNVELGQVVVREMSVMFSDLREFTPLSERLGPRGVIGILNRYFASLEDPIASCGGFIDSFNGDEIMALFGVAPDRAVDAGVGMWRALDRFNARAAEAGEEQLNMGIGVNTGALVLGTVGGRDRLKCGVVGDTVNLASRIEQLTKRYDCRFLIGEQTYLALEDHRKFSLRKVDRVAVKGKSLAVRLYEVLDAWDPETRARRESTRELLDQAWAQYEVREFETAAELFEKARQCDPDDAVMGMLAARAAQYRDDPPPPDWQGYETLDHK